MPGKENIEKYADQIALYSKVLQQGKNDKYKIYRLHKPFTSCIAKG